MLYIEEHKETILVISHRLSTIIYIENGVISLHLKGPQNIKNNTYEFLL